MDVTQPAKSALSEQGVQSREASEGQNLGVGHSVLPGYSQDMAEASHVESVESPLLFCTCRPCFTGIEQCTDDTGAVHCHLRSSCQLRVCPNSSYEASECRSCLADPLVDLSVYR